MWPGNKTRSPSSVFRKMTYNFSDLRPVVCFFFLIRENSLYKLELLPVSFAALTQHQEQWQTCDKNSLNISWVIESWTHLLGKQNHQWLTHTIQCGQKLWVKVESSLKCSLFFCFLGFFPRKLHTQQWPLFLPSKVES